MKSRKLSLSIVRVVLLFVVTVVCGEPIFGQAAARPNRGAMPTGSYSVSDIENISLTNGNLNLGIPLASLPPVAGGKLGLTLRAEYNSKLWDTVRAERQPDPLDPATKHVVSNLQMSDKGGWRIGAGYSITFENVEADYNFLPPAGNDPEYNLITFNDWIKVVLTTPDGATHELRPVDYFAYGDGYLNHNYLRGYYKDTPNTTGTSLRYYSFDGSHLWAKVDPNPYFQECSCRPYGEAQSWTLYLPDGTKIEQASGIQRITDNNGNKVKIFTTETAGVFAQHYQDEQTGRDIRVTYDAAGNGGLGQNQVHYQTVGGEWKTIAINYGSTHVFGKSYPFGDLECAEAAYYVDAEITVIRSIVYPPTEPGQAGRQFTFTYNSDTTDTVNYQFWHNCWGSYQTVTTASHGWGSLSQIGMPTGATVNYAYTLDSVHSLLFNPDDAPRESLTTKTLIHDGTSDTWIYGVNPGAGGFTAPDGSSVTETMYPYDRAFTQIYAGFGGKEGLVYRTNRSNKVMVERHWTLMPFTGGDNIAPGANVQVAFNPVVDAEYTSLLDDTPNHNPVKMSAKTYQYDFNGNLIQTTEYDWFDPPPPNQRDAQGVPTGVPTGVPAGATVLRVTNNSYHNPATTSSSGNVYAKRSLSSATPRILNALQQTSTGPAITQLSYDGQPYGTAPTVGNLTSQSVWDDFDNKWITSSQTYGAYGNLDTKTDPRGKVTQFLFGDLTHALPTAVVVDPQNGTGTQTSSTTYDFSTGLVTSQTDPNGKTSNIDYTNQLLLNAVDPFGRPGIVTGPLGQRTRTLYEDSSRSVTVMLDLNTAGDGLLKSQVLSDQLGRALESRQFETATTYIAVRKSYDTPNRISKTSNPFRSGETIQWTTTVSDLLGRVVSVTTPDNAVVSSAYNSNTVSVTDQAGKSRRSASDALGRLIQVYEDPSDLNASGFNYLTSYDYDVFGNLRHVYQGSQTRTFTYDSLSRLRTAFNPESGTVGYTYDDNGNLTRKTDARGIHIDYVYDALNRNTTVDYSNTSAINPDITRVYDNPTIGANGKGRLYYDWTWTSDTAPNSHTAIDAYDALGRVKNWRQHFWVNGNWSAAYPMSRNYDLAGHVTSQSYPSGRTVSYAYDAAGRTSSFSGNLGDGGAVRNYSTGISYSPFGGMAQEQFGTDTPLYNKQFYNVRGQLAEIRLGTYHPTDESWWNRGAILNVYSGLAGWTESGPDNNGNLRKQMMFIPNDDQISGSVHSAFFYDYDSLNRVYQAREVIGGANHWVQYFNYDRYGNRTIHQTNTWGTGIPKPDFGLDPANNNRLTPPAGYTMSYDDAGNLTNDTYSGQGQRTYDAENRMKQAWANNQWQEYTYNADGQRVRRKVDGAETWQVYGMDGELLAEYAANGSLQKEYGYRNGQLLITASVTAGGWGAPPSFTAPATLVAGWEIKLEHLTELRSAVNQLRSHAGLSPFNFTVDPNPERNVTIVRADHIRQLRTALEQARSQLGLSTGGYAHPLLTENSSWISAIDFQELRNQILSAWNGSTGGVDIRWLVADQLGTPRMIFDQTGSLAGVKRHDYLPFGEELFAGVGGRTPQQGYVTDSVRQKFTHKERDNETGLDYFLARYYSSTQGRFTSVDPSSKSVLAGYPQSWNRYSYTYNNPLALIDQNGKWPTAIHELIIDRALPRLTDHQRQEIKNGSYSVDDPAKGGQRYQQANEHGMTIPGQSQEEAARNANGFIMQNVEHAQYASDHTGLTSSLYDFGRAFHTVSDMTSPKHEGYQTWRVRDTLSHMRGESQIDHFRMGLAVGVTLNLYAYTYGQAELQRATGYRPGTANDPSVIAIQRSFSLPGSNVIGEGEALYEYRNGLRMGLKFDWATQDERRGK